MLGYCVSCNKFCPLWPGKIQDMKSAQAGRRLDYYPTMHDIPDTEPPVRCDGHKRAVR